MGSGSSKKATSIQTANDAVDSAAEAWDAVAADLKVALSTSNAAINALQAVKDRYDTSAGTGKKGIANAIRQGLDKGRKIATGSRISQSKLEKLALLTAQVDAFHDQLGKAKSGNDKAGKQLNELLASFQDHLKFLKGLTTASSAPFQDLC